tara:strand:- start:6 stop:212 length:207 start_codon:yes stop_codon:yes gene_type:complete
MKIAINTWQENIYEIPDEKLDDEFLKEIKTYTGSDCEIAEYFMEHGKKIDCVNSGYTDEEPYRVIKDE